MAVGVAVDQISQILLRGPYNINVIVTDSVSQRAFSGPSMELFISV